MKGSDMDGESCSDKVFKMAVVCGRGRAWVQCAAKAAEARTAGE